MEIEKVNQDDVFKRARLARLKIRNLLTKELLRQKNGYYFTEQSAEICKSFGVEPWHIQELQDQEPLVLKNQKLDFFFSGDPLSDKEKEVLKLVRLWRENDNDTSIPEYAFWIFIGTKGKLDEYWKTRQLTKDENLKRVKNSGIKMFKDPLSQRSKFLSNPESKYKVDRLKGLITLAENIFEVYEYDGSHSFVLNIEMSEVLDDLYYKNWDFTKTEKNSRVIHIANIIASSIHQTLLTCEKKKLFNDVKHGNELWVRVELNLDSKPKQ